MKVAETRNLALSIVQTRPIAEIAYLSESNWTLTEGRFS